MASIRIYLAVVSLLIISTDGQFFQHNYFSFPTYGGGGVQYQLPSNGLSTRAEIPIYYQPGGNYTDSKGVTFRDDIVTELPFTPCNRDDPQASVCLKNLVQKMLPNIADGYPPFNVPPLDPFFTKRVTLAYASSIFGGSLDITDIYVRGISMAKITNLKANVMDINKFRVTMDSFYKKVIVNAKYKMTGNVARIPINTDGVWSAVVDDIKIQWDIRAAPVQRSNNMFLNITRFGFRSQPEFKNVKFHATNLVPRNEILNDFAVRFMNRNYKVIYNQMYPWLESKISDDIMIELVNNGISKIPVEVLFPLQKST